MPPKKSGGYPLNHAPDKELTLIIVWVFQTWLRDVPGGSELLGVATNKVLGSPDLSSTPSAVRNSNC